MPETTTGSTSLAIPGIEDLQPLGRGGFGTVYQGWQPDLRRKVAVKVLDAPATDAESAARFRREGMAMGALSDHPNVVPVYATGTVGDRLYLVMPLLPDGSLADLLRSGPLVPDEVVRVGRGLADALSAAHGAGVLHRDVKPANVLLTPYGTPQLADFGVARLVDTTQTMGGSLTATVAYAAPEVLAGEPATEASDVYSLGATLHAALRGAPPYEARPDEAPIAMAVRVLSDEPPDLRGGDIPLALIEVIERAMARDPAHRYPTAAALRDALDAVDLEDPAPLDPTAAMAAAGATSVLPATDATAAQPAVDAAPTPAPRQAWVEESPPAPAPRDDDARRSAGALLVVLLVAALVAGAIFLATRDDGGSGDDGTATDATEAPATSTPPTTAPAETTETTATETTETTAPETSETTAPPPAEPSGSAVDAVRDYYAVMDAGRIDEGWARLSPSYQERTGESSYRSFWESIAGVEVLDAASEGSTVVTTLRYTRDDGTTSTERATLELVEDGGQLLIDDYRVG